MGRGGRTTQRMGCVTRPSRGQASRRAPGLARVKSGKLAVDYAAMTAINLRQNNMGWKQWI